MRDPNLNYFNDLSSNNFISTYVFEENIKIYLRDIKKFENFSHTHVNIRSINSEKLQGLILNGSSSFNIICVTEVWSTGTKF